MILLSIIHTFHLDDFFWYAAYVAKCINEDSFFPLQFGTQEAAVNNRAFLLLVLFICFVCVFLFAFRKYFF